MTQSDLLNLEATDRETEQIDLGQAQCLDYGSNIVCQVLYPIAWCAGRRGDAAAIEQDDFTAFGQTVRQQGIPMVQAAAEMGDEEEWDARRLAPSAVSESVTIDFDEAGRRGQMVVGHASGPFQS